VQGENESKPNWLRVLVIGRRPKNTLIRVLVLVVICFVLFKFILLPIRIEGISMEPTCPNGKISCVNRLAFFRHEPQRGDIVSVRLSAPGGLTTPSLMYMKRVIALPGETISFYAGKVYINGELLDEPYIKLPSDWNHEPIQCGPDQYYVVGDNRSMPFRLHEQGRADRHRIVGKLLL
jgi:signal peptidase I